MSIESLPPEALPATSEELHHLATSFNALHSAIAGGARYAGLTSEMKGNVTILTVPYTNTNEPASQIGVVYTGTAIALYVQRYQTNGGGRYVTLDRYAVDTAATAAVHDTVKWHEELERGRYKTIGSTVERDKPEPLDYSHYRYVLDEVIDPLGDMREL